MTATLPTIESIVAEQAVYLLPPMTPAIDQVFPAFVAAQAALGKAQKSSGGNYGKFANLTACWDEITPVFEPFGLAIWQRLLPAPIGLVRIQTVIIHGASGQFLADGGPVFPVGKPQDPQSVMASITYARRGTLCTTTGLTQEDDDGATAAARDKPKPKAKVVALATVAERDALMTRIQALPDEASTNIGASLRASGVVWTQLTKAQLAATEKIVDEAENMQ